MSSHTGVGGKVGGGDGELLGGGVGDCCGRAKK